MRTWLVTVVGCGLLVSCDRHDPPGEAEAQAADDRPVSETLVEGFPLLPMVEKKRWSLLREAEVVQPASVESREQVAALADELRRLHPFASDAEGFELGGIRCDFTSATFRLPAVVRYPDEGDERHPGELELLLCGEQGRSHETLLVTKVRPLHLELLLHLAGYRKGAESSRFTIRIVAPSGESIAVKDLVRRMDGRDWSGPIEWEFSGSGFDDLYAPDLSGDFAIFWHAHDAVLRVADEEIGSGELKLKANRHAGLPNGSPATIEITAKDAEE